MTDPHLNVERLFGFKRGTACVCERVVLEGTNGSCQQVARAAVEKKLADVRWERRLKEKNL